MSKLKNFVKGIIGGVAISTFAIMPIANAGSVEIAKFTLDGHEWKIKLKDAYMLRFNKDGNVKCSYSLTDYKDYLTCAVGYVGSTEYSTIRDYILDYI